MIKMNKSRFAEKRKISVAMFSRTLSGQRDLSHDVAVRVARVLKTRADVWKRGGSLADRTIAWVKYLNKFNGEGNGK